MAIYAVALCQSVCVSVCLSQINVLSRWLKVGSSKQCIMIAWDPSFLTPKILTKFQWDHPQWGCKMQVR